MLQISLLRAALILATLGMVIKVDVMGAAPRFESLESKVVELPENIYPDYAAEAEAKAEAEAAARHGFSDLAVSNEYASSFGSKNARTSARYGAGSEVSLSSSSQRRGQAYGTNVKASRYPGTEGYPYYGSDGAGVQGVQKSSQYRMPRRLPSANGRSYGTGVYIPGQMQR